MASRMLNQGFDVTVFARRPEVASSFAAQGAVVTQSLSDGSAGNDVVVVCLYSDTQVHDLLLTDSALIDSLQPGSVLVIHTTGSPRTAQDLAAVCESRSTAVLDAPVSGTTADVAEGHITLLVGGESNALEHVRVVLASYADPIQHIGPIGSGQTAKLLNNALLAANVRLVLAAERAAIGLGLEPGNLSAALRSCSGGSWVSSAVADAGSADGFFERVRPYLRKDMQSVLDVASEAGIDLGLLETVALSGEPF